MGPDAVAKAFRQEFKAWLAEVDGVRGRIPAVRRQLWMLLATVVEGGWCSKKLLPKILGHLSYIFQYRQELYGLQHHIYSFAQKLPENKWRRLPGFILDELRSFALHFQFATWNMRKRLNSTLIATDATPTSRGAVACEMPRPLAQKLWRQSEGQGRTSASRPRCWPRAPDRSLHDFIQSSPRGHREVAGKVRGLCVPQW